MRSEAELEEFLHAELRRADLPDRGFSAKVAARLHRHRQIRLGVLLGATVLAIALGGMLLRVSAPPPLAAVVTPATVIAALVLVGLCSLAWIATASALPPRYSDRR